jgi:hypothetical protein
MGLVRYPQQCNSAKESQPLGSKRLITIGSLVNHSRRSEEVELSPACRPPTPCKLLMSSNLKVVAIQPSNEVADDRGLNVDARLPAPSARELGYASEVVLPTVFEDERDRFPEIRTGLFRGLPLTVRSRNLRRVRDEPLFLSFDDRRELVMHGHLILTRAQQTAARGAPNAECIAPNAECIAANARRIAANEA